MCTYITKTSYIQSKGELHEKWKYAAAAVLSTCLYTYINTDIQVRLRGNGSCELKSLPTDLTKMIEAITYSNRLMHVYNRGKLKMLGNITYQETPRFCNILRPGIIQSVNHEYLATNHLKRKGKTSWFVIK